MSLMKAVKLAILLILLPLFSFADHIFGGELTYVHISGNTYKVTLSLYADCAASSNLIDGLLTGTPSIQFVDDDDTISLINLVFDPNSGIDITPVCPAYKDSTKCVVPTSTIPGIKRFDYSKNYTLPYTSANWKIIFNGALNNNTSAGRIGNLINVPSVGIIYLVAELNNVVAPNSSPQFTSLPTPFYCVNTHQQYNQGAIDSDNDSLVFSLAPGLTDGVPVFYSAGYSETLPLSTLNGAFNFSFLNGQMDFTPDVVQNALVVNKVTEYRNGIMVGSSIREMTFVVLSNCANIPPSATLDTSSLNGGVPVYGNVINVCEGQPLVSFNYPIDDPDGDSINITHTPVPAGASFIINGNNTPSPSLSFSWNTSSIAPGIYTFYVTLKDSHCPVSSQHTQGFTIRIVRPTQVSHSITKPTNCAHKATIQFNLSEGITPRTVTIKEGGSTVKTYIDSTGVITDSLPSGSYSLYATSANSVCTSTYNFMVVDSGIFPFSPLLANLVFCIGNAPAPLQAIAHPGATINWFDISGNPLSGTPVPSTSKDTTMLYLINQQYLTCTSKKDTVKVVIAPKPNTVILHDTNTVCYGEKILLRAEGADIYTWLPEEKIFYEPNGFPFIRVLEPAAYTLIASSALGCKDTIAFRYDNIERCCKLSYPNAFTPNGDGRNDTWSPLMHGNHSHYELSIYNRWGTRLFHSFTPNAGWNGIYEGKPQDVGTYYYYLQSKCLTGQEEEHKGEVHLIR
jgi:gliding motility-associated-like protein